MSSRLYFIANVETKKPEYHLNFLITNIPTTQKKQWSTQKDIAVVKKYRSFTDLPLITVSVSIIN